MHNLSILDKDYSVSNYDLDDNKEYDFIFTVPFDKKLESETVRSLIGESPSDTLITEKDNSDTKPIQTIKESERRQPVTAITKTEPINHNFICLQKWEGTVIEVQKNIIIARLMDLIKPDEYNQAEIPIEEISYQDKELVTPGAVFYWNIGYYDSKVGQRKRESTIRFRRLPAWNQKDIERAKDSTEKLLQNLKINS